MAVRDRRDSNDSAEAGAVTIDGRRVGADEPAYVIAKAGANHDSELAKGRRPVEEAAAAGTV